MNASHDIDKDKVSDLLFDQLKDNYKRYVDTVWKSVQFSIIGIGWLVTTVNGKETFAASASVRYLGLSVIFSLIFSHAFIERRFFMESQRLSSQILKKIPDVSNEDIRHWRISLNILLVNTTLITFLLFFMLVIISKSPDLIP